MNVVVCIKQVPDTEQPIRVRSDGSGIEEQGINWILNYYDEHAVEEALRLRERHGGRVTVVCAGPARATEAIRTALAMGADEGILVSDPLLEEADHLGLARALARTIQRLSWDVVLCGRLATDDNAAVVGPALAEFLGVPQATAITKLEITDGMARVEREVEGGVEVLEVQLPAVFSVERTINEPRYPTLPGIMRAKRQEIRTLTLADLGLAGSEAGGEAARVRYMRFDPPPRREAGEVIRPESPEEAAERIAAFLRDVAKVL
ncbi:MAG: electron transfer flavoprotein subunit beta/FixA family protein [Armatimonadetes bacterium]|nr:electron transfer flavoprotein subunit beta/FixA family protein [Armatimonadota bacterium]MDW8153302.1 electron transfer flavoprotein subunit beta/FixA family protein [Armatimonadota bacterium]